MQDHKKLLENFIKRKSDKRKIIVIYWPTGSGKTDMSIDIAQILWTEIISTDSRQIYKYMNIWTGKITQEEKKWIKHHMLDIILPDMPYSVWEFKNETEKIMEKLYTRNKIPMLVWGTGLYINSLIFDFDIPKVPADKNLRDILEREAEEKWKEYIFERLQKLDPDYDRSLHPNNLRYVIRALEVKILTWKSKTEFKKEKKLKYDVLFLTPGFEEREYLYERINKRVKIMFEEWLLDEVKSLLKKWYNKNSPWLNSIGYREVIPFLSGEISLEESIEKVQQNSRNYAKRQLTWFRKYNQYIK